MAIILHQKELADNGFDALKTIILISQMKTVQEPQNKYEDLEVVLPEDPFQTQEELGEF